MEITLAFLESSLDEHLVEFKEACRCPVSEPFSRSSDGKRSVFIRVPFSEQNQIVALLTEGRYEFAVLSDFNCFACEAIIAVSRGG